MEEHLASLDGELKSTTIDLFATREQLAYYKNEHQKSGEEMTVINQVRKKYNRSTKFEKTKSKDCRMHFCRIIITN